MQLRIQRESFDQVEIDGLIQFYRSPIGQSLVRKIPVVTQKAIAEMQIYMQQFMPKTQAAKQEISAEVKSLKWCPTPMTRRVRTSIVIACAALILGAVSVGIVKVCASNLVTGLLWRAAEAFASPGEFLWWSTLGGALAGYPSGVSGHFVWVVGTALFWFVVTMSFVAAATGLRARRRAKP